MSGKINLLHGDCLEVMDKLITEGVQVDAVITDPPYGTTSCKWDSVIPFDEMWERLNKLIKPNGAVVLSSSQPFTSALIMSNVKRYSHEWIWEKPNASSGLHADKHPMKVHENIIVFKGIKPVKYYPQMEKGSVYKWASNRTKGEVNGQGATNNKIENNGTRFPRTVQKFKQNRGLHPTQKPVLLMEYLIKTYTNEGELVLDFTMGSGTTMVACKNLNRRGIGIELDESYYQIATQRVNEATEGVSMETKVTPEAETTQTKGVIDEW